MYSVSDNILPYTASVVHGGVRRNVVSLHMCDVSGLPFSRTVLGAFSSHRSEFDSGLSTVPSRLVANNAVLASHGFVVRRQNDPSSVRQPLPLLIRLSPSITSWTPSLAAPTFPATVRIPPSNSRKTFPSSLICSSPLLICPSRP